MYLRNNLPGPEAYDRKLLVTAYNVHAEIKHTPPVPADATKKEVVRAIHTHAKNKPNLLWVLKTAKEKRIREEKRKKEQERGKKRR